MSVNIEIVSLRANNKPGSVKDFLSVRFGGVTVHECKLLLTDGDYWVATPDRPWTGDDGKTRYSRLVELSDKLKTAVTAAAVAQLEGGEASPPSRDEKWGRSVADQRRRNADDALPY